MSFDQTKAFEAEDGVIVSGGAGVFSGSTSPIGSDAPIGSVYLQENGIRWVKTGSGTSDWHRASLVGGTALTVPFAGNQYAIQYPSTRACFISGSATGQSIVLPDAILLEIGITLEIYNSTSDTINVKDFSGTTIFTLGPNTSAVIVLEDSSTSAGSWISAGSQITATIFASIPSPVILSHNGTMSNNQLIGYTNLANIAVVVGFKAKLLRVTQNNSKASSDFSVDFFFGESDGGNNNGFHRMTVVNNSPKVSLVAPGASPVFNAGDIIGLYYRDEGANAVDLNLGLFFEATF